MDDIKNSCSNEVNVSSYIIVTLQLKMGIFQLTGVFIIHCTSCVVTVTISSHCQAVIKLMLNNLGYILTDDTL